MVKCKKFQNDAFLPERMTGGAAAFDLRVYEDEVVPRRMTKVIPLGFGLELPEGWVAIIKERSGLATWGIHIHGGVIDSDYRGVVGVIVENSGVMERQFPRGSRIAQMLIVPCYVGPLELVGELTETARGANGFGSTGG